MMEEYKTVLKKGDRVQVISGRDRGRSGVITAVMLEKRRVKVEGLALVKRHVKPNAKTPAGGIEDKESGLSISKVLLFCPKCDRGVRVRIVLSKSDSKKARACCRCSTVV